MLSSLRFFFTRYGLVIGLFLYLAAAQMAIANTTLLNNGITGAGGASLNCFPTETPCSYLTGGYTCCPSTTRCVTTGPYQGTCAIINTAQPQQCSPSSLCIPDRITAPTTAECCAPEEACTPGTGCEYRRPHFCPSGRKHCGADYRCVAGQISSTGNFIKGEYCCPKRCVTGNPPSDPYSVCCAAGGTCTDKGCVFAYYSQCGPIVCGLYDRCLGEIGGPRSCCPVPRVCGNTCCPQADASGAFVCVDEAKGLCCRQGEIKTSHGTCCLPGKLAAGDICCSEGTIPLGHSCGTGR